MKMQSKSPPTATIAATLAPISTAIEFGFFEASCDWESADDVVGIGGTTVVTDTVLMGDPDEEDGMVLGGEGIWEVTTTIVLVDTESCEFVSTKFESVVVTVRDGRVSWIDEVLR